MEFSFPAHVALLEQFLDRHQHIVQEVESRLLNVQRKSGFPFGDRHAIDQVLGSCFFDSALPPDFAGLKEQLSIAHRAQGFEPVQQDGGAHDFDPARWVVLAYSYWTNSRWPGRNGRMAYARTIYVAFILRQLEQLSLRIWDGGKDRAAGGLFEIQRLLDRLNAQSGSDTFVRAAPWLVQTAQGPLTRQLQPYFAVAEHISDSLDHRVRLEIHRAGALLAGGHLRSQLRYRARESQRPIDDPDVLSVTRNSNSMDAALLIRDLVPLLEAYETSCATEDRHTRLMLSDAILQGLSADPELLLTRLDVLGPATTIEEVFIERRGDGRVEYTEFGRSQLRVLSEYRGLISTLARPLKEDANRFDPTRTVYSPLGIVYGFCADILSNMAIARLLSEDPLGLTLEDMFFTSGALDNKLRKAQQWEALPRHTPDRPRFEQSVEWGTQIFNRLLKALDARVSRGDAPNASGLDDGRLFVRQETFTEEPLHQVAGGAAAMHAQEHCVTSDLKRALETGATAFPKSQILSDRREGRFLASVESDGKWFAVSKVLLTACICQGKNAVIADVPPAVVDVLRLTCPELLQTVG